jgi:hypothetical protein
MLLVERFKPRVPLLLHPVVQSDVLPQPIKPVLPPLHNNYSSNNNNNNNNKVIDLVHLHPKPSLPHSIDLLLLEDRTKLLQRSIGNSVDLKRRGREKGIFHPVLLLLSHKLLQRQIVNDPLHHLLPPLLPR